jgi:hypothetical protein
MPAAGLRALFSTAFLLIAFASVHAQPIPVVDATTLGTSPTIYLNTWRFQMGDSAGVDSSATPAWADPALDDSGWAVITTDKTLAAQGFKSGFPGFCWYRVRIRVPANVNLSLYLADVLSSYQVFIDGRPAGGFGGLPPHEALYETQADAYAIPSSTTTRDVVIAVRVWAHPAESPPGIESASSFVGHSADIANMRSVFLLSRFRDHVSGIVRALLFLAMGAILLTVYANQRSQREWFWLGLAFLADGLTATVGQSINFSVLPFPQGNAIRIPLSYLSLAITFEFLFPFVRVRPNLWARAFQAILVVAALVGLSSVTGWASVLFLNVFAAPIVATSILLSIGLLAVWWARGNREAGILLVPVGLQYLYGIGGTVGEIAFILGLQNGKHPHNVLPVWQFPGGAFDLNFVIQLLFIFSILLILQRRSAISSRQSERLEAEIAAARTVQQVLIPEEQPAVPGLLVESAYIPAQQVGGDFFQVLPLAGSGDAFIVVGDVSGKGLQAAMTVSLIVGTLRTLAEYVTSPAEILAGINRRLYGRGSGFATCIVLKIAPDGEVTLANAGHLNPYIDGVECSTDPNLPLGLSLDVSYTEVRLQLGEDQRLTLLTDGVVEAMNAAGELYGFEQTRAISSQPAHAIADAVKSFVGAAPQADDVTVLTVTRVSRVDAIESRYRTPSNYFTSTAPG